jgi:hypothetical protein
MQTIYVPPSSLSFLYRECNRCFYESVLKLRRHLPVSTADALAFEEGAWISEVASQAAYDSYRGK